MKRRDFLKNTVPAGVIMPALVGGFSFKAFGAEDAIAQSLLLPTAIENDHVLVIIQLNGGNDGLNTVIPLDNFSNYVNARSNIYIPEDKVLKLSGVTKAGLHPAMTGLQAMYNDGELSIIQSVGYPRPNFSHFRATDIWMSASDSTTVVNSGWAGRFLDAEFPNFHSNWICYLSNISRPCSKYGHEYK